MTIAQTSHIVAKAFIINILQIFIKLHVDYGDIIAMSWTNL